MNLTKHNDEAFEQAVNMLLTSGDIDFSDIDEDQPVLEFSASARRVIGLHLMRIDRSLFREYHNAAHSLEDAFHAYYLNSGKAVMEQAFEEALANYLDQIFHDDIDMHLDLAAIKEAIMGTLKWQEFASEADRECKQYLAELQHDAMAGRG